MNVHWERMTVILEQHAPIHVQRTPTLVTMVLREMVQFVPVRVVLFSVKLTTELTF